MQSTVNIQLLYVPYTQICCPQKTVAQLYAWLFFVTCVRLLHCKFNTFNAMNVLRMLPIFLEYFVLMLQVSLGFTTVFLLWHV